MSRRFSLLPPRSLCACVIILALDLFSFAPHTRALAATNLLEAIRAAPTDGTETVIDVDEDFSTTDPIVISSGQNIVLRSGNSSVVSLGASASTGLFVVQDGGHLTFGGNVIASGKDKGRVLYVEQGGSATIEDDAVLCNGRASKGGAVWCGGSLDMSGGTIADSTATNSGGAVYINKGATFSMSDGTITTNWSSYWGAGVTNDQGTFELSGGSIEHNVAENGASGSWRGAGGGGIYSTGTFLMSGGSVAHNEASSMGGGIHISIDKPEFSFEVTGGTISDNKVGRGGGEGLYVLARNGAEASITSCTITGNSSLSMGGGIYVAREEDTLTLHDALVTQNSATHLGGRVWTCKHGHRGAFSPPTASRSLTTWHNPRPVPPRPVTTSRSTGPTRVCR